MTLAPPLVVCHARVTLIFALFLLRGTRLFFAAQGSGAVVGGFPPFLPAVPFTPYRTSRPLSVRSRNLSAGGRSPRFRQGS